MKIGIMGAMHQEIEHIKKRMCVENEEYIANRTYSTGKIDNIDVVLAFSNWGKVASACTATTLIQKFGCDFIIFTGVAGALSPDLNIGDIVVGSELVQHDMDATPIFSKCEIPLTGVTFFKVEEKHADAAVEAAKSFLSRAGENIGQKTLSQFFISNPTVKLGLIATGDQFIKNKADHSGLKFIEDKQPQAVEMEGAAVAQVCHDNKVPFVVFRTISDKADHSAHIDFEAFINQIAGQYASGVVEEFMRVSFKP